MDRCHICHQFAVRELRDFGPQPICNRFLATPSNHETFFPMVLGQCERCGAVQLVQFTPPEELKSRFPWITYTEPSAHLERLVQTVAALPGVSPSATICGIFLPSDPTLTRFEAAGFKNTWRLVIQQDFDINDPCAATETIQDRLDGISADVIAARRGQPDVIVIRHILEHTQDIEKLMRGLHRLVKPKGYVIFEVPDCQHALESYDYTTLWEEHISYFTAVTLAHCLRAHGWLIAHQEKAGPSLVAIAQPSAPDTTPPPQVQYELDRAQAFTTAFPEQKRIIREFLSDIVQRGGKIAVFGAGHLSCVFINVMELSDFLHCVIDDHEKKQGRFMPGNHLPIRPTWVLVSDDVILCISSLGVETDARIAAKNPGVKEFLAHGGQWRSMLPGTNYFLEDEARARGRP